MTCKDDCLHYNVCHYHIDEETPFSVTECNNFKNKADFVEVETLKSWLYQLAINNVGIVIHGNFSKACEDIISRLDGLRNFARERK